MLVQKLRLQRGWSQQQLAELSGLNVRTIQRIEKGQEPSVESLKSLAAVFNVEFSTLKEQVWTTSSVKVKAQKRFWLSIKLENSKVSTFTWRSMCWSLCYLRSSML